MRPVAFIGDIHGGHDLLRQMLDEPRLMDRELVFLGDYVNRGPQSRAVVQHLIQLRDTHPRSTTFLRGNHDAAFNEVLQGSRAAAFLLMGGSATVRSWVPEVVGDVGQAVRASATAEEVEFFATLSGSWSRDGVLAVHSRPADLETLEDVALLIVGHHQQDDASPRIVNGCAYLDTGCGSRPDGRLSALLLPEREFISN
ncbi:MAG: metallophosphoesterase [Actinomycetota bacterium]